MATGNIAKQYRRRFSADCAVYVISRTLRRRRLQMKIDRRIIAAAMFLALFPPSAFAQQIAPPGLPLVPLGYFQLTSIDTVKLLSTCAGGIPSGSTIAYLIAETQAIRL